MGLAIVLVSCGTAKLTREKKLNTPNNNQTDNIETLSIDSWWQPTASSNLHWHYQIGRAISNTDLALLAETRFDNVQVLAIDTFDNPVKNIQATQYEYSSIDAVPEEIPENRVKPRHVICYVNVGAREDWRPDDHLFSTSEVDLGAFPGWAGEYLLDTRSTDLAEIEQQLGDEYTPALAETIRSERQLIRDILTLRFLLAKEKGCDAIEPDNVDYWIFNQTQQYTAKERYDFAREYLHWIADTVHEGLTADETVRFNTWLQTDAVVYDFSSSSIGDASLQEELNSNLEAIKDYVKLAAEGPVGATNHEPEGINIGLSVGLKNTVELLNTTKSENNEGGVDLVAQLADKFDWAQNESCGRYSECNLYSSESSFIRSQTKKPVFWVEYRGRVKNFCPQEGKGTEGMSFLRARSSGLTEDVSRVDRCEVTEDPIDLTPPVITASYSPETPASGWYGQGASVEVIFTCTDNTGDVVTSFDGAATIVMPLTGESAQAEGTAVSSQTCTDANGNTAEAKTVYVKIDTTPPTALVQGQTLNEVSCLITDSLSGTDNPNPEATILPVTNEGKVVVECSGADRAGNASSIPNESDGSKKVFDIAPPILTVEVDPPTPTGNNGWYTNDVMVTFSCVGYDVVDTFPQEPVPFTDGSYTVIPADYGNCSNIVGEAIQTADIVLNIDTIAPDVSVEGVTEGTLYTLEEASQLEVTCSVTDATSGSAILDAAPIPNPQVDNTTSGVKIVTCTGEDTAGNVNSQTIIYTVTDPLSSEFEIDFTNSNSLEAWQSCGNRDAVLTTIDSRPVVYLKSRKRSSSCLERTIALGEDIGMSNSYTLSCEARRSGNTAVISISDGQNTAQNSSISTTFQANTATLSNPIGSALLVQLVANQGSNTDLYVDSCTLVANN